MNDDLNIYHSTDNNVVQNLRAADMEEFKNKWYENVHNPVGPSGPGGNKLRTYTLFKSVFEAGSYCKMI